MDKIQAHLHYTFTNKELLQTALTHASWINEHQSQASHNERLEFLGDAVLELSISDYLFATFADCREGDLTRFRSALVNENILARIAKDMGLDNVLRLGKGEEAQGGRQRDAVLADALEALLGAIYLDGGFKAAQQVVAVLYASHWPTEIAQTIHKDYKTQLQEITQKLCKSLPVYTLMQSHGPEHAKCFNVRVALPDATHFQAEGASVKRAEQNAAKLALETWPSTIKSRKAT